MSGDAPARRTLLRRALRWLRLPLLLLLAGCAVLPWLERQLIYFPDAVLHTTPDRLGLRHEEVWFDAADGTRLHGWFLPAAGQEVRRAVLFAHGNAGNIADRVHFAKLLHGALDVHLLMFDYRGFGRSEGTPGEEGLYLDGVAALATLRGRAEVDPEQVVLFGRSLGGGVVAEVALRDGAVAGVILESAFTSVPDMAAAVYPIPGLPALVRTRYDNLAKVRRLEVPLLVVHGEQDEIVPFRMGQALAEAAGERATLHRVPGGHHNDTWLVGGRPYTRALREFLDRVLPP